MSEVELYLIDDGENCTLYIAYGYPTKFSYSVTVV